MDERESALRRAAKLGLEYLGSLDERHVGARADASDLVARLGGAVPESGTDPVRVVEDLAEAIDPGLIGSAGPRCPSGRCCRPP